MLELDYNVLRESSELALDILNESDILARQNIDIDYVNRHQDFQLLGIGSTGETAFIPRYSINFKRELLLILENDVNAPPETDLYYARHVIKDYLREFLTTAHVIKNETPAALLEALRSGQAKFYKSMEESHSPLKDFLKGYDTPKLSRFLVRVFGEDAEVVKVFNSLPRNINEDASYRLHVSVLPHHIVGMSYYSSYNHGGERWNGQNGTSCQDTRGAGDSNYINSLPANLKDETLGIAWLSYAKNDCIYEARALVRIIVSEDYETLFFIDRIYRTNVSTEHIFREGLINQFGDKIFFSTDIHLSDRQHIEYPIANDISFWADIEYDCESCNEGIVEDEIECETCDGRGSHTCDDCNGRGRHNCDDCDGTGEMECGDCDDGCVYCGETGFHLCSECDGDTTIECDECDGAGQCTCHDCDGEGSSWENVECIQCDGNGTCETEKEYMPYLDNGNVVGINNYRKVISFYVPKVLLKQKEMVMHEVI